jgi:hypothetical protein
VRSFDTSQREGSFYDITIAGSGFCGVILANRRLESETSPANVKIGFSYDNSYDYTLISGQKTSVYVSFKLAHSLGDKQEV